MTTSKHLAAEQNASFAFPIIGAFAAPILIGLFAPFFLGFIKTLFIVLIFLMPTIILLKVASDCLSNSRFFSTAFLSQIKPLPGFFVFGTDLKKDSFPWVTAGIITVNTLLFFTSSEEVLKAWVFVPYGDPSLPHVLISLFTCTFLHDGIWHLIVNMILLWIFGGVVESRIGPIRFLYVYFLSILFSGLFCFVLLILQTRFTNSSIILGEYHSLGASGAIAGIMGIFVVRCYFARIKMTIPLLFLPFFSLPMKIQGTVLTSLFFALDLSGSVTQFRTDSNIDYWAHVGGYAGGFLLGYLMKLHHDASKEAIEVKAERLSQKTLGKKDATELYEDILHRDPENEKAIRYLFKLHRHNQEKREHYFGRLIQVLAKKDFSQALSLFEDHFPNLMKAVPGPFLLRFGLYFHNSGLFEKAWPCLELAAERKGDWQPKAIYSLGLTYEEMGRFDLAKDNWSRVVKDFPNTPFQKFALREIESMSSSNI